MKKDFWKLLFCIALISGTNLFGSLFVVQPEQVYFTSEGLYVEMNGTIKQISSVRETENGYYVAETKYYTCPNCGSDVEEGRFCPVCNFPDDAKKK